MLRIDKLRTLGRSFSIKDLNAFSDDIDFSPGEILEGKIVKRISESLFLIELKGKRLSAQTSLSLKEGMKVNLKVLKLHPLPLLKILNNFGKEFKPNIGRIISLIKSNPWKMAQSKLSESYHLRSEEENLKGILETVGRKLYEKPDSRLLKKIIDKMGFSHEAKIKELSFMNSSQGYLTENNVKELTLRLIEKGHDSGGAYKAIMELVQNTQLLNIISLKRDSIIYFLFPMFVQDNYELAELLIDKGNRTKKKKKQINILFLLNMSRLGPIKAELTVIDRKIRCFFYVINEVVKGIIDRESGELRDNFVEIGFKPEIIKTYVLEEPHISKPLIFHLLREDESNISIII